MEIGFLIQCELLPLVFDTAALQEWGDKCASNFEMLGVRCARCQSCGHQSSRTLQSGRFPGVNG